VRFRCAAAAGVKMVLNVAFWTLNGLILRDWQGSVYGRLIGGSGGVGLCRAYSALRSCRDSPYGTGLGLCRAYGTGVFRESDLS